MRTMQIGALIAIAASSLVACGASEETANDGAAGYGTGGSSAGGSSAGGSSTGGSSTGGSSAGGSSAGGSSAGGSNAGGSNAGGSSAGGSSAGGSNAGGAPPVEPTSSDPVTTAMTGSHATYEVGPGKTYEEPDTVPWGALTAGDVVNVHFRAEPYKWKLCVRGQGTSAHPIVINGVTDSSGHRPKFDFSGARTASGCNPGGGNDVFNTGSQWSLEDYAGIILRAGVGDPWGYKPAWIVIKNLELTGAAPGASFVDLNGQTRPYIGSPAAIWIQPSADIVLENNVIYDNAFGVFSMSKDSSLESACERLTVRSCRVWGNGVVGSYLEHNLYVQSTNPVIEGNYFGLTRSGSEGSTYKSRSSGEIFRYNYVEASARAIDWVYSEDQTPGIATQPDYGVDYAYGNVIVNDCSLGNCASNPIHYGGDNLGEQDDVAAEFTPDTPYRSHLFFYNNTVVNRVPKSAAWRAAVFDLSLRTTTVDAWNNIFFFENDANYSWVQSAGKANLVGTNLAFGAAVSDASDKALAVNFAVSKSGTLLSASPGFVSGSDLRPGAGSAAVDAGTDVPAGVSPNPSYAQLPVSMEPSLKSNGMTARTLAGAVDLGALEAH